MFCVTKFQFLCSDLHTVSVSPPKLGFSDVGRRIGASAALVWSEILPSRLVRCSQIYGERRAMATLIGAIFSLWVRGQIALNVIGYCSCHTAGRRVRGLVLFTEQSTEETLSENYTSLFLFLKPTSRRTCHCTFFPWNTFPLLPICFPNSKMQDLPCFTLMLFLAALQPDYRWFLYSCPHGSRERKCFHLIDA